MKFIIPLIVVCFGLVGCETTSWTSWYGSERAAIKADYEAGKMSAAEYHQSIAMYDQLDEQRRQGSVNSYNQYQQLQLQQEQAASQERQLKLQQQSEQRERLGSVYQQKKTYQITEESGLPTGYELRGK